MAYLIRILILFFIFFFLSKKIKELFSAKTPASTKGNRNPFEILGVQANAGEYEIKKAYKKKLAEYHPDKVSHLGEEIQELSRKKTQEINWAYEQIKKRTQ